MSVRVFIGLGANLGDPRAQLAEAIRRLEGPGFRPRRRARLYRSPPLGPPGQPDYLNTAVEGDTTLEPEALLDHLQAIEGALGRVRSVRWGPRVVDLDLLLYGERQLSTPRLVVPHPELSHRTFVLAPLADLAPELVIPGLGATVRALASRLGSEEALEVLEDHLEAL